MVGGGDGGDGCGNDDDSGGGGKDVGGDNITREVGYDCAFFPNGIQTFVDNSGSEFKFLQILHAFDNVVVVMVAEEASGQISMWTRPCMHVPVIFNIECGVTFMTNLLGRDIEKTTNDIRVGHALHIRFLKTTRSTNNNL